MPFRQVRQRLKTDRTETALRFPQVQQFASSLEVVCHCHPEALFKVDFPGRVERIRCAFDLCVPLDRHAGGGEQPDGLGVPLLARSLAAKDPVAPGDSVEVGLLNPAPGFVGMPAFCPLPESKKDGVVHFGKGLLTAHVPVIVSPAPDEGIELAKQIAGGGLGIDFDESTDFLQKGVYTLPRWLDEDFAVVRTDLLSEELKAVRDMRDPRLLLREF